MGTKTRHTEDGKIIRNTMIKVPLHPTQAQAALFEQTFSCCRYVWNRILADEQEFYAATDQHFLPTPARYKAEAPFLREVDSQALANVHQNLRQAFQRFFAHPEQFGYPKFKAENSRKNSYTTYCQYFKSGPTVYLTEDGIRLPKAGIVPANLYRKPLHWWKLKSATVSRSPAGKYYCTLLYEYTARAPEEVDPAPENTVGVSYSPSHLYVDSDGNRADLPQWIQESQEKLAAMERKLSHMEPGSKNYDQQLQRLQKLREHIANQRKDFIHKESHRLAKENDAVCVDDLVLRGKTPDTGFGQLRECLRYKLERQGKPYSTAPGGREPSEN